MEYLIDEGAEVQELSSSDNKKGRATNLLI